MTDWIIISEDDLVDAQDSSSRIRAYCHIHGSDHQRSLSINKETGFGDCHSCGAKVLVRELNPDAAENIERGGARPRFIQNPKYRARAKQSPAPAQIKSGQIQELDLLRSLHDKLVTRLSDPRATSYLQARGLSLSVAEAHGVGYVPASLYRGQYSPLNKWADRLIFPVGSHENGLHFVGRSLKFWYSGMDEKAHRGILTEHEIDPYIKTYRGGWFNHQTLPSNAVFTEGPFDALALIEAGIPNAVAVVGTAINQDWMPKGMGKITIAFDGDSSGREKSVRARDNLHLHGYVVELCEMPDDGMGKDWSERYRRYGKDGMFPLLPDFICTECKIPLKAEDTHIGASDGQPYCQFHVQHGEQEEIPEAKYFQEWMKQCLRVRSLVKLDGDMGIFANYVTVLRKAHIMNGFLCFLNTLQRMLEEVEEVRRALPITMFDGEDFYAELWRYKLEMIFKRVEKIQAESLCVLL